MKIHRDDGDLEVEVELPIEDAERLGSGPRIPAVGDVAPR
jgi:hypothetical protein